LLQEPPAKGYQLAEEMTMTRMKVFISYSHMQARWVHERLEPCLRAGGCEVLVDHRRFIAGTSVVGQMDALQSRADRHVLILTADYLASAMCVHEMERALALDPSFLQGLVIPVRRDDVPLPHNVSGPNPLCADLRDDNRKAAWHQLLAPCGVTLGISAPDWLTARDEVARCLNRHQSVNLVIRGRVAWRGLIDDIAERSQDLAEVDLDHGETSYRQGLVNAILEALGSRGKVPAPPRDLAYLSKILASFDRRKLVMRHTDHVAHRPVYGIDLFAALRHAMEQRQLVLLLQSRASFATLMPRDHPLSKMELSTVEMVGDP
jgi:hypothetical protein